MNELQVHLGSYYVNNFNEFGRSWQVNVMGDSAFRAHVDNILQIKVRSNRGEMIPLATVMDVRDTSGPALLDALQHVLGVRRDRQYRPWNQFWRRHERDDGHCRRETSPLHVV